MLNWIRGPCAVTAIEFANTNPRGPDDAQQVMSRVGCFGPSSGVK